jgi:hypothetical protein
MSMILALAAGQALAGQAAASQVLPQAPPASRRPAGPGALGQGIDTPKGSPPESTDLQLPSAKTIAVLPSVTKPEATDVPADARDHHLETVTSRRRPDYDAAGIRTGPLLIFPTVSSVLGYDSNVYRQVSGVSDAFGRLRAAVEVRTDLSRHAVMMDGYVDQRVYSKYTTENALTYEAHLLGRLDFARGDRLTGEVRHTKAVVERGATGEILNTREPVRYNVSLASIDGRKTFGRLSLGLGGTVSYSNYQDAETPAGAPFDQQFRDLTLYQVRTEAGYALAAGPEIFVSATGEARRYRVVAPPIIRDSNSIEVLAGLRSDITPLLRGQFSLGYLYANFKDPTIPSRGALGVNIGLDYLVTPLTTLRAGVLRNLRNVASANSPAALVTEGRIGVDHELLRNLILSASAGYQYADYIIAVGSVRRITADGGAQWLINRRMRLDFDLNYQRRTGAGQAANQQFGQVRGSVGFAYQL